MVLPPEASWAPGEKFKFILSTAIIVGVICLSIVERDERDTAAELTKSARKAERERERENNVL